MFRYLKIIAAAGLFVMAAGPAFAQTVDAVDETARGGVKGALDRIDAEATTRAAEDAALQTQIDAGTIGGLSCNNGQVAKFNGTTWECSADQDTDISAAGCDPGQILVSDGTELGDCVVLPTTTDPTPATACPVFNAAMVDAAAMASDLLIIESVLSVSDDPTIPEISCRIKTTEGSPSFAIGRFAVFVESPFVTLEGFNEVFEVIDGAEEKAITFLRTTGNSLSTEELAACRAEVLESFVWRQHCAPFLQP